MPGMPGMLVAFVSSGAKVMTVMVPPEPPGPPGTTPHPATRQAPTAVATRVRYKAAARCDVVMSMHHSAPEVTQE
ncbi:hypothetical protein Sxan_64060 [Streptomyces xanthophaeus]|uniref:Uncharacterized protein n=1 Tax=Streptomyces xanthophaeus TaxID=67385 RepID=A0A919LIA9_9ACTN|nr:hypothetical protein Sxan_64060 [Streptomyces xanthophaeus]